MTNNERLVRQRKVEGECIRQRSAVEGQGGAEALVVGDALAGGDEVAADEVAVVGGRGWLWGAGHAPSEMDSEGREGARVMKMRPGLFSQREGPGSEPGNSLLCPDESPRSQSVSQS